MEGVIGLRYSTDNGSTWLPTNTFYELKALHVHSYLRREEQQEEEAVDDNDQNLCVGQATARLVVIVAMEMGQFSPEITTATTAQANYVYVNKLRCASLINLRIAATSTEEFQNLFNDVTAGTTTSYNTTYLVPEDIPDIDFGENYNRKFVQFTLKAKKGYDITT